MFCQIGYLEVTKLKILCQTELSGGLEVANAKVDPQYHSFSYLFQLSVFAARFHIASTEIPAWYFFSTYWVV